MTDEIRPLSINRFSPLAGNPFLSRSDVAKAVIDLFEPLIKCFSPQCAQVTVNMSAAHFERGAISLEGFARPLWGIVPYVVGGGEFKHWDIYRKGLANGTNPKHPEFWGSIHDTAQLQVEGAALGFALLLVKEHVWDPLDEEAKENFSRYLVEIRNQNINPNNWLFFRVMIDLGLDNIGVTYDKSGTESNLKDIDNLYVSDGWYRDGNVPGHTRRIDHYNGFALHFYGLIYGKHQQGDDKRAKSFNERSRLFAQEFQHWFDNDGSNLPYGRSLTYRFACCSFWGALAYADNEALPWGVIKGYYLRNLRWWSKQPVSSIDSGILSVGYSYPNTFMSESYNSSCSPYWAMKAFIPLALPETHPFWTAKEIVPEERVGADAIVLKVPGMVVSHNDAKETTVLVSGPDHPGQRYTPEKYCKFAYSTKYGFSVENDYHMFRDGIFDSMLGLSDDGDYFRVRSVTKESRIAGNILYSVWQPWTDVTIETWLIPYGPWHIRVHSIDSDKEKLYTTEGAFAISFPPGKNGPGRSEPGDTWAKVETAEDIAGIFNYQTVSSVNRKARVLAPAGNTNIMFSRSAVPQLTATIPKGKTTLACACFASPMTFESISKWESRPDIPDIAKLRELIKTSELVGVQK